jgi:putative oxidoreductase
MKVSRWNDRNHRGLDVNTLLDRIPLHPHHAAHFLRIALAAIYASHGLTRLFMDRVAPFGEFLDGQSFPLGIAWAWGITLFEIAAAILLLADRWLRPGWLRPICLLLIIEMLAGIVLVHWQHGWFVVGHGTYGMEYSVMLIAALLALFSLQRRPTA